MASKRNRKNRQQEAAARREEIRRQFERQERRRRAIWVAAIIVVLMVIIGSVAWALTKSAADKNKAAKGPTANGGLVAGVGILRGSSSAPVTVTLYEDFQCPFCEQFETSDGATIDALVTAKKIKVDYRPVAFLTQKSDYTVRALNAAACVKQDKGVDAYVAMHKLLFGNQPSESGPWPSDSELIKEAVQAGASKSAVSTCIKDGTYKPWVSKTTDAWSKAGYSGTPIVLVNGKQVSKGVPSVAQLKAAVAKASSE